MALSPEHSKALNELIKITKELAQRIRLLEERMVKLENSINDINEKLHEEMRIVNEFKLNALERIEQLEVDSTNISLNIKSIERKLKEYARKADLKELKEYLDLLKPINKVYVTRKELDKIIEKKMREGIS